MKKLARVGAVLYIVMVFFVVFHNTGYQWERLLEAKFITPLMLAIVSFIVIMQVIKEAIDEPITKPKKK